LRENAALRARLEESERHKYGTTFPSITLDLAALIGRTLLAARKEGRAFHEAARAIEAIKAVLYARTPEAISALAAAADRVNVATGGKQRRDVPKWNEDGPVAERVRDLFATWTVRPLRADADGLGAALNVCARMVIADRILPLIGTEEERTNLYARTITEVLETSGETTAAELAELVIVACAKASGVRRPSRLFDAARKREKAAL
jgi:hypothetical protein